MFISNNTSIRENKVSKFSKVNILSRKEVTPNNVLEKRVPLLIFSHPSKEQINKSKFHQQTYLTGVKKSSLTPLSYAQVTSTTSNILKIKEVFPALPNKKILKIHDTAFSKQNSNKERKIQPTMKGLSRKKLLFLLAPNSLKQSWEMLTAMFSKLMSSLKTSNQHYVLNSFAPALEV